MNRFLYILRPKKSLVKPGETWMRKNLSNMVTVEQVTDVGLVYWRSTHKTGVDELNGFLDNYVRKYQ